MHYEDTESFVTEDTIGDKFLVNCGTNNQTKEKEYYAFQGKIHAKSLEELKKIVGKM